MEQSKGYVQKDDSQKVYKLKKDLCRLKQDPQAWFSRIEAHFMNEGFEKCYNEHTLFAKTSRESKILIVNLYIDDRIFTGNDELMFLEFKNSMVCEFDMTDLGKMRYFLGVKMQQESNGIHINKRKYILELLKRFGM